MAPKQRVLRATTNRKAYEVLTEEQLDARIRIARERLGRLGSCEDVSAVPMRHLTNDQLDERILAVEAELRRLKADAPWSEALTREPSRAETRALARQFAEFDYVIAHPHAAMEPAAALDGVDDEEDLWAAFFAAAEAAPEAAPEAVAEACDDEACNNQDV